jgi:hypothetical protein
MYKIIKKITNFNAEHKGEIELINTYGSVLEFASDHGTFYISKYKFEKLIKTNKIKKL